MMTGKLPPSVVTGFVLCFVVIVGLFAYAATLRSENEELRARLTAGGGDAEIVPEALETEEGTTPSADAQAPTPAENETLTLGAMTLGPTERATLASQLGFIEPDVDRRVWLTVTFGDPDAAQFAIALGEVFARAGFAVQEITVARFPIRPGIYFMAADDDPPDHVNAFLGALEATGWDVTSGRGYRAFYDEKKQDDPTWNGFPMVDDQTFVIAIGRGGEEP